MSVLVNVFSSFLLQVEILCDIAHFYKKEKKIISIHISTSYQLIGTGVSAFKIPKEPLKVHST